MAVIFQVYSVPSSKVIFVREPSALILIPVNALFLLMKHITACLLSCINEKMTSTNVCST